MRISLKSSRYFILTSLILLVDQITKFLVIKYIPLHSIGWNLWGDFFRLIHVRNLGMAFSLGSGIPNLLRILLLIVLPLSMLVLLAIYIAKNRELTGAKCWILAAILGGGVGNLIDRAFRNEGVVDFLDFKFYGLFGLERWPTFNVADSTLVVSAITLILLTVIQNTKNQE